MIQAAVYGSNMPWGMSDSEAVVRAVVEAAKEVVAAGQNPRLWILSGQVSSLNGILRIVNSPHGYVGSHGPSVPPGLD